MPDEGTHRLAEPADVIGADELVSATGLPPVWTPVLGAIVRITTPAETGTGFFIADDRVITNHHVVPSPDALARGAVRAGRSAETRVTVAPDAFFRTSPEDELDYTVFAVERVPGVMPLFLAAAADPQVGDQVYVIGYRRGRRLEYSSADGAVQSVTPPYAEYRADTEAGMSGSPVLSATSRQLLALHHFGDDDRDDSNRGVLATAIAADLAR
jgi:V8-like Glu-specific endopeptidase